MAQIKITELPEIGMVPDIGEVPVVSVGATWKVSVSGLIMKGMPDGVVPLNATGTINAEFIDADTIIGNHETTYDHTSFMLSTQRNVADGVAGLDGFGKISESQLPSIAITEVHLANSLIEQNALDVQEGDVVIRTDETKTYIYDGTAYHELTGVGSVPIHETFYNHAEYDSHVASTSNPHIVTLAQIGADATGTASSLITDHETIYDHSLIGSGGAGGTTIPVQDAAPTSPAPGDLWVDTSI